MLDYDVENEIFLKYKNALVAIGVDLTNNEVIDYITGCNYELEARFQAIISYWYWLKTQEREIGDANQLLIQAFYQQWKPFEWKEEFLNNDEFRSPAEKWWDRARKVEILNSLIIDVQDNFWSGGKIIFKDPNGEPWTMDLERAMDMSWQQIIEHYQRVTGIIIESHPGRFVLQREKNSTEHQY